MTPIDPQEPGGSGPSPALLSALTTEHYTLQAQRSSTIVEANGRGQLFLSAVSGATVALALVAQLDGLGQTFTVFALTVLPALLALGMTSYARLADLAVHDAYFARAIGRIRAFYHAIAPEGHDYWLQPSGDGPHAVMAQTGDRHSRWHHLSHTATSVAAVNGVLAGVLAALGSHLQVPTAPVPALAALGRRPDDPVPARRHPGDERHWFRSCPRGSRTCRPGPGDGQRTDSAGQGPGRTVRPTDHHGSTPKDVDEMAAALLIEEEFGTTTGYLHPHNGYWAGDFSATSRETEGHESR